MAWFQRKRHEVEQNIKIEVPLAQIAARLNGVEVMVTALLLTLNVAERDRVLDALRRFVVQMGHLRPPKYVPQNQEQLFRDELSRVLQIFIETAKDSGGHSPQST
jgi:hypothetical protein